MTHPLTGKDIQSIWDKVGNDIVDAKDEDLNKRFVENTLIRAVYDLAIEHYSKWIYENGDEYVIQNYEHNIKTDLETIVADFKQAMRPQQQENN